MLHALRVRKIFFFILLSFTICKTGRVKKAVCCEKTVEFLSLLWYKKLLNMVAHCPFPLTYNIQMLVGVDQWSVRSAGRDFLVVLFLFLFSQSAIFLYQSTSICNFSIFLFLKRSSLLDAPNEIRKSFLGDDSSKQASQQTAKYVKSASLFLRTYVRAHAKSLCCLCYTNERT